MEEAPMATEPEQVIDTERGITDERMSDSNELESNETKMTDAQVERPSRAAEERDFLQEVNLHGVCSGENKPVLQDGDRNRKGSLDTSQCAEEIYWNVCPVCARVS